MLYKIRDFDPNYKSYFGNDDIIGYDVYSGNDKVGDVKDLLVDENGRFRYFVVDTGFWIFGKKVLLPIGRAQIDHNKHNLFVNGLTKEQVENMPEFDESMPLDYDYEERVRGTYRPNTTGAAASAATGTSAKFNRNDYHYDREPDLFNMTDRDHQNLRLYEERLIANKTRRKAGEVQIGKHVETETAKASVPVEKERIVVERRDVSGGAVTPGEANFRDGEVARVEVYEEVADIHKEAFVREEVSVRKEVERDTVDATEKLRREELDVKTKGQPNIDKR